MYVFDLSLSKDQTHTHRHTHPAAGGQEVSREEVKSVSRLFPACSSTRPECVSVCVCNTNIAAFSQEVPVCVECEEKLRTGHKSAFI